MLGCIIGHCWQHLKLSSTRSDSRYPPDRAFLSIAVLYCGTEKDSEKNVILMRYTKPLVGKF